jgi:predicted ATPase
LTLLEREPLLEVLAAGLREAAGGAGQIALVYGEAGIGKTALVDCFTRERTRPGRVLRGARAIHS